MIRINRTFGYRLESGKVFINPQVLRALSHFFNGKSKYFEPHIGWNIVQFENGLAVLSDRELLAVSHMRISGIDFKLLYRLKAKQK